MNRCRKCGIEIGSGALFCVKCEPSVNLQNELYKLQAELDFYKEFIWCDCCEWRFSELKKSAESLGRDPLEYLRYLKSKGGE